MKKKMASILRFLKQHSVGARVLSMALSLVMLFYVIPTVIYAEVADALSGEDSASNESTASAIDSENVAVGALYEVEELREENVKHFHLKDGTYIAAQYASPVHYVDETGKWQDIDNVLSEDSGEFSNSVSRIRFSKKITGSGKIFTLKDKDYSITMSFIGGEKNVPGTVINGSDALQDTELQKMMNLEKLSSKVYYENILSGIDLEYIVSSFDIKENIVVKEMKDSYNYSFELKLKGLSAELLESGDVLISDEKTKETIYTIPAPVACDSNISVAPKEAIRYSLSGSGNKYTLTVSADTEWMNSEERVYPIIIDPTVEATYENSTIATSTQNGTFTIAEEVPYICVDSTTTAYVKINEFPEIPEDSYISEINLAIKHLASQDNGTPSLQIHEITSSWNRYSTEAPTYSETVIDVSSCGTYYVWNITDIAKKWIETPEKNYGVAIRQVLNSYGAYTPLTVRVANPISTAASTQSTATSTAPYIELSYVNTNGLEDYWPYSSQSAGKAGSGSVNLATGNLTFTIPTFSTVDSLMPYTPTLVYNSAYGNKAYIYPNVDTAYTEQFLPNGFKLNLCETVVRKEYTTSTETYARDAYYLYEDADGTGHAFFKSGNVYLDNDGLGKTMTVGTSTITITDDSRITRTFSKTPYATNDNTVPVTDAWVLTKITDQVGNAINIIYDSTYSRPLSMTSKPKNSTAVTTMKFHYIDGMLYAVQNIASGDIMFFRYSATYNGSISETNFKYLREIEFGMTVDDTVDCTTEEYYRAYWHPTQDLYCSVDYKYSYESSGKLSEVENYHSSDRIKYTWWNGRASKAEEYGDSENLGQAVSFTYGTGYTDVKSTGNDEALGTSDDITTRYVLDDGGRASSVYSFSLGYGEIYGATTGEYSTQANIKNNLTLSTSSEGDHVNYLLNGDFSEHVSTVSASYWTFTGKAPIVNNESVWINLAASESSALTQYVFLKAGEYTLTVPIQSHSCKFITAKAHIYSISGSGLNVLEELSLNDGGSTFSGYKDASVSFTVPSNINGGDNIAVAIEFEASSSATQTGFLFVDNVSLTKGIGTAYHSIVSYGSFDESGITSAAATSQSLSDVWVTETGVAPTVYNAGSIFGNTVKLVSNASDRYVKQRIFETDNFNYANNNMNFTVSGFAYAAENATSSGSFAIIVDVIYYQGLSDDVTVRHTFDFNNYSEGWQYVLGSVSCKYEAAASDTNTYDYVKAIDVYCDYSNQYNGYALFDNISVLNNSYGDTERYYYYSNGLLKRTESAFYTESYYYDTNRNLTRVANNYGKITDYTYTSNHLVDYTIDYDFVDAYNDIDYPYEESDPDSLIVKTEQHKTDYTYNSYGLCTLVEVTPYVENASGSLVLSENSMKTSYTYNTQAGSYIFGVMTSATDANGTVTRYFYDESRGHLLAAITEKEREDELQMSDGEGLAYEYDYRGNLISVTPAYWNASNPNTYIEDYLNESVSYTYTADEKLNKIETRSTVYTFNYDVFGNQSSIRAGDNTLATYTYNQNNGKLNKITYGNGYSVEYVYDRLENLIEIWYNEGESRTLAYEYEYTKDGQVHKYIDHISDRTTVYKYDSYNRLSEFYEYEGDSAEQAFRIRSNYDAKNRVSRIYYEFRFDSTSGVVYDSVDSQYTYSHYGKLYRLYTHTAASVGSEWLYYDDYGRSIGKVFDYTTSGSNFCNTVAYVYELNSSNDKLQIGEYHNYVNSDTTLSTKYEYTYDEKGNIDGVYELLGIFDESFSYHYTYDDLNQLVKEINGATDKTYYYTYDGAGNIIKKETLYPSGNSYETSYGYTNSEWGDLLTSYRGQTITYDEIGNPLSYYNGRSYVFTWDGRRLSSATLSGGASYTFTYNDEGMRTSKTYNGNITTNYYYSGSQLIAEDADGDFILYVYDSTGSPIGFQYHKSTYDSSTWDVYWYEKNLHGDIVGVYDKAGTKLIAYFYDAWGNTTTNYLTSEALSSTASFNPFTYRGYYYDSSLNLYYLNSRYYDPVTFRFISPDSALITRTSPLGMGYKNLFSYCDNNPVMRVDSSGAAWETIFDILSLGGSILDVQHNPDNFWAWLGLGLDVVDVCVPFVGGLGEAVDAYRFYDTVDDILDTADAFYDVGKAIDAADDIYDASKIGTYNDLRKIYKGSGLEVHHIIEKRLIPNINHGEMLSVALDKKTHRKFTNAWRAELGYGLKHEKPEIYNAAMKIYANYPTLKRAALETISKYF